MSRRKSLSSRVRRQILSALRKGIAPRIGLQHIAVGRAFEIEAIALSLQELRDCGASFRMLVGDYGTGKTFLLHLVQLAAQKQGFVTLQGSFADKHRLLIGSGGRGRGLLGQLVRSMSTARHSGGGALELILEEFLEPETTEEGSSPTLEPDWVTKQLEPLMDLAGGRDFVEVITAYLNARSSGEEAVQNAALRWFSADYGGQREARSAGLPVSRVLGDGDVHKALLLLATFVRIAGFRGLVICLDEAEGIMSATRQVRQDNLSELAELHDAVEGPGLGIYVASTIRFVEDEQRGCFSHGRLRDRVEKHLSGVRRANKHAPVLALQPLLPPDTLQLIRKIRDVYSAFDPSRHKIPDEALGPHVDFLLQERGHHWLENTREVVQHFVRMLDELDSNPDATWQEILGHEIQSDWMDDEPMDVLTRIGGSEEEI